MSASHEVLAAFREYERTATTVADAYVTPVVDYSRGRIESELADLPDGTYRASDAVKGDGVTDDIPVEVAVTVDGTTVDVDFTGTADQVAGNVNAPLTVAKSAVYFVIRCITDREIPPNHGCYEPVTVEAPDGSLLNPEPPAAVVGGTGANPDSDGLSGVQVGMTNTLNTPVETLEAAYPVRVERYALREDSGGDGRSRGSDGLVRSLRVETDATVSLLTERRRHPPRGVAGGDDGQVGSNRIDGESVGAKVTREVDAGTTVTVETPGGGGHSAPIDGGHGTPSSDGTGMAAESTDEDDPRE